METITLVYHSDSSKVNEMNRTSNNIFTCDLRLFVILLKNRKVTKIDQFKINKSDLETLQKGFEIRFEDRKSVV